MSRLESLSLVSQLERVSGDATMATVPIDAITPNPSQPRKYFSDDSLAELADSIRAQGIIQPLAVREVTPSQYELIAGERRWRAARLAGLREVPVTLSKADSLEAALVENLQRENMTIADEVAGIAQLVQRKQTGTAAAKAIGKNDKWVSKRICIAEAPAFVLDFVTTGRSGDLEGIYELARLAGRDEEAARAIIGKYVPGTSLRALVREARNQGEAAQEDESEGGAPDGERKKRTPAREPGQKGPAKASDVDLQGQVLSFETETGTLSLRLTPTVLQKLTALLRKRQRR